MRRIICVLLLAVGMILQGPVTAGASDDADPIQNWTVHLRTQVASRAGPQATKPAIRTEPWRPAETAIVVCDMWDAHHCYNAVQRVNDMAGRMNEVLRSARRAGALVIHAPSGCVDFYHDHPARRRAQQAPTAKNLPPDIDTWCERIPSEEQGIYPLDQSDGGCDDATEAHRQWRAKLAAGGRNPEAPWTRQIDKLEIEDIDAISDSGVEIWNLLEARGVANVIVMGVHTNMCVLGRPFGLRQMARNGRNVVLVRDLTDTMYNPAMWPHVDHHTGTDRIVQHIEKYVCPTILSSDLIGGPPHRFFDDLRTRVAMVVSEFEYETYATLPAFAQAHLGKGFHVMYSINDDPERHDLPGIEILKDADLAILSLWRRTPTPDQLQVVRDYVASRKPLVAIRTTSHAFATRDGSTPPGRAAWPTFDRDVLRGNYAGHFGNHPEQGDPPTRVWLLDEAAQHSLAAGIPHDEFTADSWLYKMAPLLEPAVPVLMGRVGEQPVQPVAWTVVTDEKQRIFYTSLGSQADFERPTFQRLLANGIHWAVGK
jgi:nicotinamidase-related amidase